MSEESQGSDKMLTPTGGRVSDDGRLDARITGNPRSHRLGSPLSGPMVCAAQV